MTNSTESGARTSPVLILFAWAFVGIPWLWGVLGTLDNAAKLFQ